MGKRIIQQARGKGSLTYRVRRKAFVYRINYPSANAQGMGRVEKIFHSLAHSAPLAKIKVGREIFFIPTVQGLYEGQQIEIGENANFNVGNITNIGRIPLGMEVCNIEAVPLSGPKFARTAGVCGKIVKRDRETIILMRSKEEKAFNSRARATIGIIAAAGRLEKPIVKAGKMYYIKHARGKPWPRTSAVKMNVVDHPFGSGRGKRIKSKIPKRNAPPGAKVGLLYPRRTGRRKK